MPKAYEAMRDKFQSEGMSEDASQTKAAKIYNATHSKPMTPHYNEQESAEPKSPMFSDMMKQIDKKN